MIDLDSCESTPNGNSGPQLVDHKYLKKHFDLDEPLAPRTVPTLIRWTPQKKAHEQLIIT